MMPGSPVPVPVAAYTRRQRINTAGLAVTATPAGFASGTPTRQVEETGLYAFVVSPKCYGGITGTPGVLTIDVVTTPIRAISPSNAMRDALAALTPVGSWNKGSPFVSGDAFHGILGPPFALNAGERIFAGGGATNLLRAAVDNGTANMALLIELLKVG